MGGWECGQPDDGAAHLVDVGRDGLPPHAHLAAVNEVAILPELEPPDDNALLRRNDCGSSGTHAHTPWHQWPHCSLIEVFTDDHIVH